jgi:peptide/nickel transport system substrate-binding protein
VKEKFSLLKGKTSSVLKSVRTSRFGAWIPTNQEIKSAVKHMTAKETATLGIFTLIFIFGAISIISKINDKYLVEVPAPGGEFSEGVVGPPRFINPLLASSDADRDLVSLIYSGLMRVNNSGELVTDLAESYQISDDKKNYIFKLKQNIYWHDGKPVTADDVVYTINTAKDPNLKSPRRANWEGVTIEKLDNSTIQFTLKQPYSSFLDNTTMGIMPKHVWQGAEIAMFPFSEYNLQPIGSGPYKIFSLKTKSSGVPDYYDLKSFKDFSLGRPLIDYIRIKFYADEASLVGDYKNGTIEAMGLISPDNASDIKEIGSSLVVTSILPRVFAIFLNQNQSPALSELGVRLALNTAMDRDEIIKKVLGGYGTAALGPIPPNQMATNETASDEKQGIDKLATARNLLKKAGWKINPATKLWEKKNSKKVVVQLKISLATADVPQLKETAAIVKAQWEKLGIPTEVKVYEIGDLNQNIIRPRKYEALFFGEIIGRNLDLFPFWHSSQRNDPGLNISLYANSKVDKLLESARTEMDADNRASIYKKFQDEIAKDMPAIFLYSPHFIYVTPQKIKNIHLAPLTTSSERFADVYDWYINTDKIWKIFLKK